MREKLTTLRFGFTLIEMLVVTTMIGLLMTMSVMSASKARMLARKTKAEAELREMVNAWLQYQSFYGQWPSVAKGKIDTPVDEKMLGPIIDPANNENPLGVVFFNADTENGKKFLDPWGHPYRVSFDREDYQIRRTAALDTSVFLKYISRDAEEIHPRGNKK